MSNFPADPYSLAQKSQKWLYQDHIIIPTLSGLLEHQLKGKRVLDIGCGNGHNSSTFLKWGASKVIGFDNSLEMINQCVPSDHPDMEFHHLDVTNFTILGSDSEKLKFHVATAVFVLQYVHGKELLKRAIELVYEHLVEEGGVFIGLIPNGVDNVRAPENAGEMLGAAIEKRAQPFEDGQIVTANFYDGKDIKCTSKMALHSNEYYEKCFREVGFKHIEWMPVTISDYGQQLLGATFCEQFLKPNPVDIVFKCTK